MSPYTERFSQHVRSGVETHRVFWTGEGPSLLFIPCGDVSLYKTSEAAMYNLFDYPERFEDPEMMYAGEVARAQLMLDWPTDGIPTVRPNLGTIFVPACAGQGYKVQRGSLPWPGDHLSREEVRSIDPSKATESIMMKRAESFYDLARQRDDIVPYHADTQGVFDIAHLLYGAEVFVEMAMDEEKAWPHELIERSLELYLRVSRHLKEILGESDTEMIHGHATPQGLYFPHAGVRISEDTAILISPEMIKEFLESPITASIEPFGGGFAHYCGKHDFLYEMLCEHPLVRAIDLGNPEFYDNRWLADHAAKTETVLYTRIPAEEGEDWRGFVERLGALVQETGVRMVLRATTYPNERGACEEMLGLWHELTMP